ncbi:5'/3'-nucleotidase SurE [Blastomonas fulva]|uniref:5'/3'-nucleotidase SurE n=1 Tax=Blastomonas fulva TaxID=1550728 RepID=UPI004034F341
MSCNGSFDLVVSGINRGDNCGLHVIYSGTVGAAREAACKVKGGPSQWVCPALRHHWRLQGSVTGRARKGRRAHGGVS